ncbi:putative AAA-ATPase [Thiorhodovibrio winogradskyi]|uniref:AAA-ATPase n=1 Tax=Thiorhodovibrio winogradskyi TaxID=77007 RepID=A0ABZ0S7K8_9GAMM|nr:ATP-binding protein [Thiorhodovibrio winogradskyi]
MQRKKLPIGISTFAKIRGEDYYYVDKTELALRLIDAGSYYFLSRPRRFGKSLLLDTLAELFQGNLPLFQGLYAERCWDWSIPYPVIRLSFGGGVMRDRGELDAKFRELLDINQASLRIICRQPTAPGCFAELIRAAEQQYGQRVVILVDEYDKPILDNLSDPELARQMREGLRNLYSVIKDHDRHIRFVFITGVSKFSKVSLFSGLNNLQDITIDQRYSALCGYTEADLDLVFAPELEGLDRQQIKDWYNGYNWTGATVYNPFDLLLLFDSRLFRSYWFETGTPTFLIEVLTQRHTFSPRLNAWRATEALLSRFDVDDMSTEALLWQTGYLTFHGQRQLGARIEYTLGYPNLEVESALNEALLKGLYGDASEASEASSRLYDTLMSGDFDQLRQHFVSLYASIPHDWFRNNPVTDYEGYWASVFYSHFAALGLEIRLEDATNHGRLDMALLFNAQVYLFEFKVVELVPEGRALEQLKARNYAEKYQALNQPIHLIGVEFSKQERNLVGFEVISVASANNGSSTN